MGSYGTVKPGPYDYFWSCSRCGAMVVNRHQHDQWHEYTTNERSNLWSRPTVAR